MEKINRAVAEQIYIMEAGILNEALEFSEGVCHKFTYDFYHPNYNTLKAEYKIEEYAQGNSEFERAVSLMSEFAPRLFHMSNYDNHVEISALPLLKYSLDNSAKGINCRAKAQIFNEMCLALGIYARKVWLMPFSEYDGECHVVNEIWDKTLQKWIMLDITNNEYWIDEDRKPLSLLEIRYMGAKRIFCTPVMPGEKFNNPKTLKRRHFDSFIYIMKNMAYMEYCNGYSVGESKPVYLLCPPLKHIDYDLRISKESVLQSPVM